jgi:thiosulfate/3-mercaptopyruvate sulfurtransferase
MAVGGLLFGMGMVIGGFCPGTAIASIATGKIDAVVFIVGFLIGSMVFGDLFPVWGDFYNSGYRGVFRLDQLVGIELGTMVFIVVIGSTVGALAMIGIQKKVWPSTEEPDPRAESFKRLQTRLIAAAIGIGFVLAFFPTSAFVDDSPPWYIIPRANTEQSSVEPVVSGIDSQETVAQAAIISAQELKPLMENNENLVIIDANPPENHQAGHLKGAVSIYHINLYQEGGIPGLIKSAEELAAIFGQNGVAATSDIVIYDDGSQKYSTRTYWVLKYLGAANVRLLHKDRVDWSRVGLPVVATPTTVDPVAFKPRPNPELLATTEYVRDHKDDPNVVLVDVRTPAEFDGSAKNSEGHIAGAININFTDLLTESGAFKDASELAVIATANGITPEKEVVFYCRTSVRGAVSFTAFEGILGYENVKLYDGAYLEWKAKGNPVVQ